MILEKIFNEKGMALMKKGAIGLLAAMIIWDIFIHRHHPYFWVDHIPGAYTVIGLSCCVFLIYFSKSVVGYFISKKEGYYKDEE